MGRENVLSKTAHGRIERYLLPDGQKDPIYGIADHWSSYAEFFYPPDGDYTKTKRWEFIDNLIPQRKPIQIISSGDNNEQFAA